MLNPVHPGRFLKSEVIEAYGLSVTQAARVLTRLASHPFKSLEREGRSIMRYGSPV